MAKNIINKKKDMMELWKETFHDSWNYIKLVFDSYFNPDNAFTVYDEDKLIAALLGVEYHFKVKENEEKNEYIKGMYLCGLATRPEYRRRGIMEKLMNIAEESAKARGFELTFLIPADSHLRKYYEKRGYHTASFKMHHLLDRSGENPQNKMNIYTFKSLFEKGKFELIHEIAKWCCDRENNYGDYITILHTCEDMVTIMSENENSFFVTDSTFLLEYPILTKVKAVIFPTQSLNNKDKAWNIVGLFLEDKADEQTLKYQENFLPDKIREIIEEEYPDCEIYLNLPFTGRGKDSANVEPYAMIKPIGSDKNFIKFENQVFKIYLMLD